jgi:hypothetical protein
MPDRVRPMGGSLTLAATSLPITPPVSLWLGLPGLLTLTALGLSASGGTEPPPHWRFRTCEARRSRS